MKKIASILVLVISIILLILLDSRIGQIPPLGKFLNPFQGFWQNNEKSVSLAHKTAGLTGLKDEVDIAIDSQGVAHIFAGSMEDMYFAQGYMHATDRLWQMEFQTHIAAGRLSEIIGEKGLKIDRYLRRFGLKFGAEKSLRLTESNPEIKGYLDSYTKGVNAFISKLSYADYPIEYKLLDYKPELWNNLKTSLIIKLMAFDLTGNDNDIELTNAYNLLGLEMFNDLYPEGADNVDPIIPAGTRWPAPVVDLDTPEYVIPGVLVSKGFESNPDAANGSNNWAVAGSKTKSGSPILCNDPHLSLNLPSIWYQVQLSCPGYNVRGVSLPGALGVVIGFNDSIAWGMTNAQRDVKDWYQIKFSDEGRTGYIYDDSIRPTKKIVEKIKVRGGATLYDTIVYTHHGPILFDESHPGDSSHLGLALKWIGHDASEELKAIVQLNQAKNYKDYKEAIRFYGSPSQNLVFASVSGDIAIWQIGQLQAKWPEQGRFLLDGTMSSHDWQAVIPADHAPQIFNPDSGFVSSANQYPTDSTYPYYYNGDFIIYRNTRINNLLESANDLTPRDLMNIQLDNYNLKTAEALPTLLSLIDKSSIPEKYKDYLKMLEEWDYQYLADLQAPAVYKAIWDTLHRLVYDEMRTSKIKIAVPDVWVLPYLLKHSPTHKIFDIQATEQVESAVDIVTLAFIRGMDAIEKWKNDSKEAFTWANFQNVRLTHLTKTIASFNVDLIQTNGSPESVNAIKPTHGPSWRFVVSLENPVKAWGVYPGGQSGNPGSSYYDNFVNHWGSGKYFELVFLHSYDENHNQVMKRCKLLPK